MSEVLLYFECWIVDFLPSVGHCLKDILEIVTNCLQVKVTWEVYEKKNGCVTPRKGISHSRLRSKRVHFETFEGLLPESQGCNLSLTILDVPNSLDSNGAEEETVLYRQPAGPNPLNHRDFWSRPPLHHGTSNSLFQAALQVPS